MSSVSVLFVPVSFSINPVALELLSLPSSSRTWVLNCLDSNRDNNIVSID